jgi:hypothetical protein
MSLPRVSTARNSMLLSYPNVHVLSHEPKSFVVPEIQPDARDAKHFHALVYTVWLVR